MVARCALPVLIALLPAVVPASASAGIAFRNDGTDVLMLVENGAETNTMTVTLSGGTYTIKDNAGMGAGANCNDANPGDDTVTCPAAAVVTLTANLGPGDDKFVSTVATPAKVLGGTGLDDLTGGSGPDELVGGPENDTLRGGAGNDKLMGDDDRTNGGGGADTVDGQDGNDTVSGGDGDDMLMGGPGNDTMGLPRVGAGPALDRGSDTLDGGEGDDVIRSGDGAEGAVRDADVLAGGPGRDEVLYDNRTEFVGASIDDRANDGNPGENDNVRTDVEGLTGGTGDDQLTGGEGTETLRGGPGNDAVIGGAGTDVTEGGDGNDAVSGGDGADVVMGGAGDDQLNGNVAGASGSGKWLWGPFAPARQVAGGDDDTMDGGDGNDAFDGGPGADRMIGGSGVDTASYAIVKANVFVTLDAKADDGQFGEGDSVGPDIENLSGGQGQNTLTGSGAGNAMSAAGGEDYMDGAGGADAMTSGGGFDVVRARDGVADLVDCGGSSDFAILDKKDSVSGSCERTDRGLVKRAKLGRFVLIKPLHGGEAFGLQGMHRFVPLKDRLGLPPGVKLDATQGAVRLTAANARGHSQSGDFSQGAFLVKQPKSGRGLTELTLTGGDLTKCPKAKAQAHSAASRRVVRRLFGRAHGRFRTRGRNSTATVRGTEWSVIDRCDGTLTTVKRGTVVVRDRVKHRTVILKSGERYLARRGNR